MSKELTRKERLFAFEYLADKKMNPRNAAVRAGYSESVAKTKAYLWVNKSKQNPKNHVAGFIEEMILKRENELERKINRLDEEIARLCFSDIGVIVIQMDGEINIQKLKNVKPEQRAAIAGIVVTEKGSRLILHPKPKAIELMGKRLGLWINKDDELAYIPQVIRGNAEDKNE